MKFPLATLGLILASLIAMPVLMPATNVILAQSVPEIQFEKYELTNGLDVILHEDHSIPVVAVNVWYHVGSGNEEPGRTGFAHLFEHMMFQGSQHHADEYFKPLQKIGATINGSTNTDRTNYWENVPSNYLELALWIESDRMGFLLPAMTQESLDNQRDVVKNERRQNYENRPYGKARVLLEALLYPAEHPYSWPTIGSQADLSAASMEDVAGFFKSYYTPNNASLVIAGDFDSATAKELVERYFATLPPGPPVERLATWTPRLESPKRAVAEDNVELPRLYLAWHSPGLYQPGDAELDLLASILADGKTSRLYRTLVYEQQIAQDVAVFQWSRRLGSTFRIQVTARQGHTLAEIEAAVDAELDKLLTEGITTHELEQARIAWEASFIRRLERAGGFGGVADQLNAYNFFLGAPGNFEWDMARYTGATVASVMEHSRRYLDPDRRVTLHVVPYGTPEAVARKVDRSQQPEPTAEPSFTPPTIQHDRLANGLDLLVVEDHGLPLVQVELVVKSGWAADSSDGPGTASMTAELLDEGTRNRDALEIAEEAKRLAVELETHSSYDSSEVTLNVLKRHLDAALALMADIALNPTFPEEELERQRKIYLGRIQQEAKQARTAAIKAFARVLYGEQHPYGQPYTGSGTTDSIKAIDRGDLQAYYRAHYMPNNAAIIMVGDISLADARRAAAAAFGEWKPGSPPAAAVPEEPPLTGTNVYLLDKPGAPQSVVVAGGLGIARNAPDYLPFELMNNAFGGKFQSRINLNLREDKGYTYGARSILVATRGVGPFAIVAPVQTQSTKESVSEILKEVGDIVGPRPLAEDELEAARGNMVKGFPQRFQTLEGIADEVAEIVRYGLPDDEWQRFMSGIGVLGTREANQAARDHLDPEALLLVVVGDREKVEPELRELGLGEVRVLDASIVQ